MATEPDFSTKPARADSGLHTSLSVLPVYNEQYRAKNRTKSTVRSRVEHVFGVMNLQFGLVKVRYRGQKKNANRLFATCALVNLFTVRKNCSQRPRPKGCEKALLLFP
jgi:DDE family transposase